jgi:molecular chaperone DnaJ
MTNRDYYEVLGVERSSTADQIKKAFKKKAAALHPDNSDTGDESAFKELVAAYEVLSDEQKRSMYDRYGAEGVKGTHFDQGNFDFGTFGDLSDIFDYFFGGGMRQQSRGRNQPQRGNDLKFDLELDFKDAVFGVEKKISIKHLEDCTECGGSGAAAGYKPAQCTTCGGMGQVKQVSSTLFGHFTQILPCPTCDGEGTKIENPCGECKGKGQVRKSKNIELKIPAGVDNGSRLRVGGGGDLGRKGAPPGDLYVVLHVQPHARFQREGVNVHIKQPISYSLAALGGEILMETVGGEKVLKIPAGIQNGTIITMRGEGVPHLGSPQRRGDQMVHIFVETPTKLSDEEKQLLKRMAEIRGESLTVIAPPDGGNSGGKGKDKDKSKDKDPSLFDAIAGVFKKNAGDE